MSTTTYSLSDTWEQGELFYDTMNSSSGTITVSSTATANVVPSLNLSGILSQNVTSVTSNTNPWYGGGYGYTGPGVYTTGIGTGGLLSNIPNITVNNSNTSLKVHGDADFAGDVTIKGKNLIAALEKIEEKLAILHPNEELEEKWEQLRGLRKMYMDLEAEIKEKEKIWAILKK